MSFVPIQRLVERALRTYARRTAIVDGDRRATYADLDVRSARAANALLAAGAGADRPVALYLPNCAEFVEADVAAQRAGITRVGIGDRLSGEEARFILEHARACVLITTPALRERLELPGQSDVAVWVVGDGGPQGYETALASGAPTLSVAPVGPDHPSFVLYTSGTTGRPKGAAHTHGSRTAGLVNMCASGELALDTQSVFLHAGPLTHGSGSKLMAVLANGGTNVVMPKFDLGAFAQLAARERATHTFLVPTMLQRLLDADPAVHDAVRGLRQISFGGSPIAPVTFRRAVERFGPILTQVYGTSEAPHPLTLLKPADYAQGLDDALLQSAGRPTALTELKIAGDDGSELSVGQAGEVLVRAPQIMRGYWRDPEASAKVLDAEGWYATGDVAAVDEDGFVTFRDRKRDLIISGGLNVYPSEVERVLAEHPGIRQVAVVGAPDEEWGEIVVAFVVPSDPGLSAEHVVEWSRSHLAGYKKPRRVILRDQLPMGATSKVLKRRLKEELWAGQERLVG